MKNFKQALETYTEIHWWNVGKKTLSYKGTLQKALKEHRITYTKKKNPEYDGLYIFIFRTDSISFKCRGQIHDFPYYAKQMIQMELVRMGDPSQLYVSGCWRPMVTINK